MVQLALFCAFFVYAVVVSLWAHHWRAGGHEWGEYVVGAVLVAGATRLQMDFTPGADWFLLLVLHYGVAAFWVIPTCYIVKERQRRRAQRYDREELTWQSE
jgi:acyl-coenzyme A synthetase/AMP-(fatty) acid ligase